MKRQIGTAKVNGIGLGCMNLSHAYGPALPVDEAARLLQEALDIGYDFLDTATLYGDGANERLIGEAVGHRRDEFFLASKGVLGFVDGKRALDGRPEIVKQQCEDSLKRLRTDRIDLYYMHRLDKKVPVEDSIGALADLVREGKILNIGVSEMSAATLRRAHAAHPVAALQSEYSLWTRNPELGVLDACAELGVAFVAFSPVGRGQFGNQKLNPDEFQDGDLRRTMPRFAQDNFARNLQLRERASALAEQAGCGLPQLALAWVLAQGRHILAIPGTTKVKHLRQNFAALGLGISPEIMETLSAIFEPSQIAGNRYSEAAQRAIDTESFDFEAQGG